MLAMGGHNNKYNFAALFCACLVTIAPFSLAAASGAATASSPDGRIRLTVGVSDRGEPQYSISYGDELVVGESKLGLRFAARNAFEDGFTIADAVHRASDTGWEQPWGERRFVRNNYNELTVRFNAAKDTAHEFSVQFRLHNDGVGFRYVVPQLQRSADVEILDELTEFRIDVAATAWWIPGRAWNRYEHLYRETPAGDIELAHTPVTMRMPSGTHISIHEAALLDYPAYVLDQRRDGVFKTNLTPWSHGIRASKVTPFKTPWRTVQIAPDAVGLLNSDLILNLNEPNRLGDVSWVEPGKYVGIWWAMHLNLSTWGSGVNHGATTAEARRYIDFAAEHGFDGVLVEGWNIGWDGDWFNNGSIFRFTEAYADFDVEAIAGYARDKGVRLVGHHETSGHVTNYESQMSAAFDLYEELGVRQVKTGYVADGGQLQRVQDGVTRYEWHDGQFAVNHFEHVLIEAAKRKISINTHEPVKDTGLRRTYPNWISREGARGQEYNAAWALPNPPEHNVLLPYTRLLAGPMDFTPGIFDLMHQGPASNFRVQSTLMQQLALYVTIYSPIQMAADLPENYSERPDAFQFIKDVPTDWDESIAVAGEVGDYVVYARKDRNGNHWYVGAITDESPRDLSIRLDFLSPDTKYLATIYRDGDDADWQTNPYDYVIDEIQVTDTSTIALKLAAGGGTAIRFRPIPNRQKAKQQ